MVVGRARRLYKYDGGGDACRPPPLPPRPSPLFTPMGVIIFYLLIISYDPHLARARGVRVRAIVGNHNDNTYRLRNGQCVRVNALKHCVTT